MNGDFETGNWTYSPWVITVGDDNTLEVKGDETNRYLNIWMNNEAEVSIAQTINNVTIPDFLPLFSTTILVLTDTFSSEDIVCIILLFSSSIKPILFSSI